MGIASYIKEIGRGANGARSLGADQAEDLMGIVLDALSVKVNMSFDAQGFFQNTDQTDKFSAVNYEIHIASTGTSKKKLTELANVGRNCPVCRMLSKPMVLKSKVLVH